MSPKKKCKYIKYYNFFVLTNKIRKKKLIKDKVQIENANMRIKKWPQQFQNKSYVTSCLLVIDE